MSRNSLTRVYVGNLGSNGIKSELEKEFSKFGIVKDVWIARNPPGFAFVEFDDHRDAEDAVRELDGRRLCGVHVRVQVSNHQGRTARQPPPANRGRSRYSPEDRSYGNQRGRFEEDRYRSSYRDTRPGRRRERSPEMDRNPRRFSRSRSRSPPRYY